MKQWLVKVLTSIIEKRQKEVNRKIAASQLYKMTDRELHDLGIGRGDIRRVIYEM